MLYDLRAKRVVRVPPEFCFDEDHMDADIDIGCVSFAKVIPVPKDATCEQQTAAWGRSGTSVQGATAGRAVRCCPLPGLRLRLLPLS